MIEGDLQDVKFLKPPLAEKKIYIMFYKKKEGYQKKLDDFNKGLKMIKSDGTVKSILVKHGFWDE